MNSPSLSVLRLLFPLCVAVFLPAFILAVNPPHLWTLSSIFAMPRRGPELRVINEVHFLSLFLSLPPFLTHSLYLRGLIDVLETDPSSY